CQIPPPVPLPTGSTGAKRVRGRTRDAPEQRPPRVQTARDSPPGLYLVQAVDTVAQTSACPSVARLDAWGQGQGEPLRERLPVPHRTMACRRRWPASARASLPLPTAPDA